MRTNVIERIIQDNNFYDFLTVARYEKRVRQFKENPDHYRQVKGATQIGQ